MRLFNNNIVPYASTEGDKIYPIVVDIKKGIKSGEAISFVTADNQVGVITVDFMDGNSSYSIEGCMVTSTIHRPDGTVLEIPCDIISQSTIEIPLGINGTYQEGVHTFDLKIVRGNGKVIGVPTMSYSVSGSLSSDGVVESDDRLPVLTMVLDNAQDKLTRLDKAIAGATNDLEVKEARDGEVTLNARLERDLAKGKIHFVDVEGSSISTESQEGYLENVEIYGNTIQDSENLADIRSVGTKVEGQELYEIPVLSTNKNIFSSTLEVGDISDTNGIYQTYDASVVRSKEFIKVKPNTTYCFSVVLSDISSFDALYEYGRDKKFIKKVVKNNGMFTTSENAGYISFKIQNRLNIDAKVQIEEGTQATPYEPYQENKLTILSSTPLEKVGDVADRIICKDGVWGVEKNVITKILNGTEGKWNETDNGEYIKFGNRSVCSDAYFTIHNGKPVISDKFITGIDSKGELTQEQVMYHCHGDLAIELRISILASKVSSKDFNGWLKDNNVTIKYQIAQPTFIPLPHDQQVKLRTFADRTHIHFDTEIEPTLKAQVPKSLGATVNTHTSQIDNLNKELDRVKKLEESTVSTVTSDKAFTTIVETNQGYLEGVKIEGKTLVNLRSNFMVHKVQTYQKYIGLKVSPNTKYTVIVPIYDNHVYAIYNSTGQQNIIPYRLASMHNIFNFTSDNNTDFRLYCRLFDEQGSLSVEGELNENACDIIILEGDHTDKDVSYFEGLKSVGQGADEISVSSANKIDLPFSEDILQNKSFNDNGNIIDSNGQNIAYYEVIGGTEYKIKNRSLRRVVFFKDNEFLNELILVDSTDIFTPPVNCNKIGFAYDKAESPILYGANQSDKKQILYYNPTTQAWEKPVLREWDSIEKHGDGKYYYHKRSEEVVLNGSESMYINNNGDEYLSFAFNNFISIPVSTNVISDKFVTKTGNDNENIRISTTSGKILINISRAKLSTQDVQGFKTWLQANNVTVVYKLAKEEVYECTNLDLITYPNETNLIVNSGAIQPKLELKVLSNVSNVVKLLQEKVSVLENKFIEGLKQVLSGNMMALAHLLYPEDFEHEIQTLEL